MNNQPYNQDPEKTEDCEEAFHFSPNVENSFSRYFSSFINNYENSIKINDSYNEAFTKDNCLNFVNPVSSPNSYTKFSPSFVEAIENEQCNLSSNSTVNDLRVPSTEDLFLCQSGMKTVQKSETNYRKKSMHSSNGK